MYCGTLSGRASKILALSFLWTASIGSVAAKGTLMPKSVPLPMGQGCDSEQLSEKLSV